MALGPGDEKRRHIVRAHIVEVSGNAERLGGLLPADLGCIQPPADKTKTMARTSRASHQSGDGRNRPLLSIYKALRSLPLPSHHPLHRLGIAIALQRDPGERIVYLAKVG